MSGFDFVLASRTDGTGEPIRWWDASWDCPHANDNACRLCDFDGFYRREYDVPARVVSSSPATPEGGEERPEGPEVAERLATARLYNPDATEYEVGWHAGWTKGRASLLAENAELDTDNASLAANNEGLAGDRERAEAKAEDWERIARKWSERAQLAEADLYAIRQNEGHEPTPAAPAGQFDDDLAATLEADAAAIGYSMSHEAALEWVQRGQVPPASPAETREGRVPEVAYQAAMKAYPILSESGLRNAVLLAFLAVSPAVSLPGEQPGGRRRERQRSSVAVRGRGVRALAAAETRSGSTRRTSRRGGAGVGV